MRRVAKGDGDNLSVVEAANNSLGDASSQVYNNRLYETFDMMSDAAISGDYFAALQVADPQMVRAAIKAVCA